MARTWTAPPLAVESERIGNNLNQFARWANTHKTAAEAVTVIAHLVSFERSLREVARIDEDGDEWGERNLGRPVSARRSLRLCCTARTAVRYGGQPVCRRLIVTAEKGGSCRSRSVNGTSRVDSQMAVPTIHNSAFPDLFVSH